MPATSTSPRCWASSAGRAVPAAPSTCFPWRSRRGTAPVALHGSRGRRAGGPAVAPSHPWFEQLGLRWHAVPAISNMCLEIGGICYRAAPFNGWYMGTEIGARNLADTDRYDLMPLIARRLGLDIDSDRSLWRDYALVELNLAVLHSFERAGVTMTDHHTEARHFLTHLEREEKAGRVCPADWTWIVPPMSASTTPVFHRYYENRELSPSFVHHPDSLERGLGHWSATGGEPGGTP
ncbi:nitric oxide synthase oxygenase [Streptosporangium lutulentum]